MPSLQLPCVSQHTWRALRASDAHALNALAAERGCAVGDCRFVSGWARDTESVVHALALCDEHDDLRGAVRTRCFAPRDEHLLSQLEWVAPAATADDGFTASLVAWYEAAVREHWKDEPAALTRVFRVATHLDGAPLAETLSGIGYEPLHAEDRMRMEIAGEPVVSPGFGGLRTAAWSAAEAPRFFVAYSGSFRERPGFPGWSEATWVEAFTNYDSFRPDLSLLLLDGEAPVAFLLAAVQPDALEPSRAACWVVQMGVVPSHRERGLGAAMLRAIEHRAAGEGCTALNLTVNVDNPDARRLYERVGYAWVGRTTVYRKGS